MFKLSIINPMRILFYSLALLLLKLSIVNVHAEVIQVPIASQASDLQSVARPERGSSKEAVIAEFGNAIAVGPAVGDPPISRWEYQDFYVYFEYQHVIHTVLKHRPINLQE